MAKMPANESRALAASYLTSHSRILLWSMQAINVLSLSMLVCPISLPRISFGFLQVHQSANEYDYLHSFRAFIPDLILDLAFDANAKGSSVQAIELSPSTTLYFPAIAIDCALGVFQGIILGINLLQLQRSRQRTDQTHKTNLQAPIFPAIAMFLFAGMCIAAFPLHCWKDVIDIEDRTWFLPSFCTWLDTCCTASASAMILVSSYYENLVTNKEKHFATTQLVVGLILLLNGSITALGVFLQNRWIMMFMHALLMQYCGAPVLYMIWQRYQILSCSHGVNYIIMASIAFVYLAAMPLLLSWFFLDEKRFHGLVCPVSCFFLASRICMVQFWAYCQAQARCTCGYIGAIKEHAAINKEKRR